MRSTSVAIFVATLAIGACTSRTDARLEHSVSARLANEPTPPAQIQVTAKDRIVTLTGVVATETERDRIDRIVRDTNGVLGVDNRLAVQQPVHTTGANDIAFTPQDRAIRDAIRQKLDEAGITSVGVEVRDRNVVLHGDVERARHEDAVRITQDAAPNARKIDDELVIR